MCMRSHVTLSQSVCINKSAKGTTRYFKVQILPRFEFYLCYPYCVIIDTFYDIDVGIN